MLFDQSRVSKKTDTKSPTQKITTTTSSFSTTVLSKSTISTNIDDSTCEVGTPKKLPFMNCGSPISSHTIPVKNCTKTLQMTPQSTLYPKGRFSLTTSSTSVVRNLCSKVEVHLEKVEEFQKREPNRDSDLSFFTTKRKRCHSDSHLNGNKKVKIENPIQVKSSSPPPSLLSHQRTDEKIDHVKAESSTSTECDISQKSEEKDEQVGIKEQGFMPLKQNLGQQKYEKSNHETREERHHHCKLSNNNNNNNNNNSNNIHNNHRKDEMNAFFNVVLELFEVDKKKNLHEDDYDKKTQPILEGNEGKSMERNIPMLIHVPDSPLRKAVFSDSDMEGFYVPESPCRFQQDVEEELSSERVPNQDMNPSSRPNQHEEEKKMESVFENREEENKVKNSFLSLLLFGQSCPSSPSSGRNLVIPNSGRNSVIPNSLPTLNLSIPCKKKKKKKKKKSTLR
eukprot:TRINITY_DN5670_c0_g3_i3.p1 TRINITY_DN5670_c0_g3~~TRINITY_DN5670_c0_g3_i3.p1  ORF type:complete len:451 (+),score=124.30 TRINITY_DN5670_c0_g3_i3:2774-4126(+)